MEPVSVFCTSKLFKANPTNDLSVGTIELRYKQRDVIMLQSKDQGVQVLVEDITSPEFCYLWSIPLQLSATHLNDVDIPRMAAMVSVDPHVWEFLRTEITDVVAEERAEGNSQGFKVMLVVQVTKVEYIENEAVDHVLNNLMQKSDHQPVPVPRLEEMMILQ